MSTPMALSHTVCDHLRRAVAKLTSDAVRQADELERRFYVDGVGDRYRQGPAVALGETAARAKYRTAA